MSYSPTAIDKFDIDTGEKVLSAMSIKLNLEGISQETKALDAAGISNKAGVFNNAEAIAQNGQSFKKLFLDL